MTIFLNPFIADTDGDMLVDGTGANFNQHKVSWKYVKRFSYVYDELNRTWNYGTIPGEMNSDINTNPFLRDTDGDGIIDGYEVQNLSMLNIPEGEWYGVLHSKDYDGDGLPDGYEIRIAYYVYKYDTQNWSAGKYLNVTNSTDATLDFDSDGLTNLQEYQRDPQGDYDGDGIPDIYDSDDDNDSIPTSVEVQNHLDPFNPADANGDLDHDGLNNSFEYHHGLNIQDADTDHDGIDDGAELNYWNVTRGLDMDTSVEYCKNPDVDKDNITDGKEIKGYDVKIITGWKSDGTPISVMRELKSDPLIPYGYNDSSGFHWSDTDSDGIPDVVESMLSNSSYFWAFYNFTQKNDWMSEYREKLWDDYNWTISYYFSLKLHKNYDKIYSDIENNPEYYIKHYNSQPQHNDSCGENATKYLTSQFNPFVVENMPPVIVKFNVNFSYYGVTAKMDIYAIVRDAGAIKEIKLIDSDLGQSVEWKNIHKRVIYISHTFWATPWGANLGANITVKTWDMKNDYAKMSRAVYGPVGKIIKMFLEWLAPFFKWLVKIGKAVMNAVNFIVEWIKNLFMSAVNKIVDLIKSAMSGIISAYGAFLAAIAYTVSGNKQGDPPNLVKAMNDFLNKLMQFHWILVGTLVALMGIMLLIKAASMGILQVIETALFTATKGIVISMLVGLLIPELWKDISTIVNRKETSFSKIWDFVLNYLGITVSYGAAIIGIIETFMKHAKSKSTFLFIMGLTIVITGYFVDASTKGWGLTGTLLEIADSVGIAIAIVGFIMMIIGEIKDRSQQTMEKASGFIAILEWVIGIGGLIKSILDWEADASTNWSG